MGHKSGAGARKHRKLKKKEERKAQKRAKIASKQRADGGQAASATGEQNLVTGYRFRVTHGRPQYNNKIGTAIAFDERCGTVYLSFKGRGIRGHIISVPIMNCKTVGKITAKF